jgi:hypothetical protein
MVIEFLDNIKVEDVDDIEKERRKFINAKHAECTHHAVETNQWGGGRQPL